MKTAAFWVLLGIAALIISGGILLFFKTRRFFRQNFGTVDIGQILSDLSVPPSPRSLSGCDSLLLPRIEKDFPNFDPVLAKTIVREHLKELYGHEKEFTIYNVVLSNYLSSSLHKTIVFQAAVSWTEAQTLLQKRFILHYTYLPASAQEHIAANCPNCSGALGYGETECPYCGSRVVNVLQNTWKFTEVREG